MTLGKLTNALVALFDNSGDEFWEEVIAILKQSYDSFDHTICNIERGGNVKVLATMIQDEDEMMCLRRQLQEEYVGNRLEKSVLRYGIKGKICIPLQIRSEKIFGYWVLESKEREEIKYNQEIYKIGKLLAIFCKTLKEEKECLQNLYLDAETNIFGRTYFEMLANRLLREQKSVLLIAIRFSNYREKLVSKKEENILLEVRTWIQRIQRYQIGNLYRISEDTIVLVSTEKDSELVAIMQMILEEKQEPSVRIAIMDLMQLDKTFTVLENIECVYLDVEFEDSIVNLIECESKQEIHLKEVEEKKEEVEKEEALERTEEVIGEVVLRYLQESEI